MLPAADNARFAFDEQAIANLRMGLKQESPESVRKVAKQFEAMMLGIMTKNLRNTGFGPSLLDSSATQMYRDLLDQQFSQSIANGRGLGLADMLVQQMTRQQAAPLPSAEAKREPMPLIKNSESPFLSKGLPGTAATPIPLPIKPELNGMSKGLPATIQPPATQDEAPPSPQAFVSQIRQHAQEAARALGVPAQGILAQAALESGWGKREIKQADGSPSFNLFGIKAGRDWQGEVAETTTTEYVQGVAVKRVERFRSYDSYAAAFNDYVSLMKGSPRYRQVIHTDDAQRFTHGLQQAGYATDPHYAAKLNRIMAGNLIQAVA